MSVSDAIIDRLLAHGIDTFFGIPGTQTLPINEVIGRRDDIEFICARHETAVTHEAWGYGEATGEPAATVVIPGPGDLHASNGLKNALNDCTPMIHLSIETEPDVRGKGGIHETPSDTYDNLVKENILVKTPESTATEVERAIEIAKTHPKGPIRVGIPKNFLSMDTQQAAVGAHHPIDPPGIDDIDIERVADRLRSAANPIVVAGNGVRVAEATEELRAVAESLGAPVVSTYKAKGVISENHELYADIMCSGSTAELNDCFQESDLALAVGTNFDGVTTQSWSYDLPDELIHITMEPSDFGSGYDPMIALLSDAKKALAGLGEELGVDAGKSERSGAERAREVREAKADRLAEVVSVDEAPFTSVSVLSTLRDVLPENTTVTGDSGGFRLWAAVMFKAYNHRQYVHNGSWASMGCGLPAAIGAKVGKTDDPVVSLIGDGGLFMCLHELHTAVAEEIPVIVVVANNNDYATISAEAGREYELASDEYAWAGSPASFSAVAEGLGMASYSVETREELTATVEEVLGSGEPALIEVPTAQDEPQAQSWMSRDLD
jgi:acetolactate synthase-1/2/3 large subunit